MASYLQTKEEWERGSCLSAALRDVKASPGQAGTLLVLGLFNCVPVLDLAVLGYALGWSRDAVRGERDGLPVRVLSAEAFKWGLLAQIALFLLQIPLIVVGIPLAAVPNLGALVLVLGGAVYLALAQTCLVRMATLGRFSAAFDVPTVWRARSKAPGLIAAALVPPLAVALAFSAASGMVAALAEPSLLADLAFLDYGVLSLDVWGMILAGSANLALSAVSVLCSIASAAATVVSLRALGHWARRAAPEWAEEAREQSR